MNSKKRVLTYIGQLGHIFRADRNYIRRWYECHPDKPIPFNKFTAVRLFIGTANIEDEWPYRGIDLRPYAETLEAERERVWEFSQAV